MNNTNEKFFSLSNCLDRVATNNTRASVIRSIKKKKQLLLLLLLQHYTVQVPFARTTRKDIIINNIIFYYYYYIYRARFNVRGDALAKKKARRDVPARVNANNNDDAF